MSRTQTIRPGAIAVIAAIRPARADDVPDLADFFAGLSMQSRYLRFFSPITPGPSLLRLLSGEAGTGTTDAVLAIRDGVIIGHCMAADRPGPGETTTTDIGVVVADAWQRRGVGSALLRAVVAGAQVRGVASVTMDVLPDNGGVIAMIRAMWPTARRRRGKDCDTFRIQLADGRALRPELRHESQSGANRPSAVANARIFETTFIANGTGADG